MHFPAGLPSPIAREGWHFLVLEGEDASRTFWPEVQITKFAPSARELLSNLERTGADVILLQYVGYGYSPDGSPSWLAEAISDRISLDESARVVVMFHETFSSGQPWQGVFWQMPRQKRCARRLLDLASPAVTSTNVNADSLRELNPNKPITIIPIGSNCRVDEAVPLDFKRLLVFGKEQARLRALKLHEPLIKRIDDSSAINSIVLAGERSAPIDASERFLRSLSLRSEIITAYNFSNEVLPYVVLECGLALMHTQSTHLLKSTAFQLSVQLGQVAVAIDTGNADPPFDAGGHYLSYKKNQLGELTGLLSDREILSEISQSAMIQARNHLSWSRIAGLWSKVLCEPCEPGKIASSILLR